MIKVKSECKFTLIELLVVIAIIAILAAVLQIVYPISGMPASFFTCITAITRPLSPI